MRGDSGLPTLCFNHLLIRYAGGLGEISMEKERIPWPKKTGKSLVQSKLIYSIVSATPTSPRLPVDLCYSKCPRELK